MAVNRNLNIPRSGPRAKHLLYTWFTKESQGGSIWPFHSIESAPLMLSLIAAEWGYSTREFHRKDTFTELTSHSEHSFSVYSFSKDQFIPSGISFHHVRLDTASYMLLLEKEVVGSQKCDFYWYISLFHKYETSESHVKTLIFVTALDMGQGNRRPFCRNNICLRFHSDYESIQISLITVPITIPTWNL